MKRLLAVLPCLILLLPASANASAWNRGCGTHGGYINGDQTLQITGFVHIAMSSGTAKRIARRVGPSEFNTPYYAKDVPCDVAQNIAQTELIAFSRSRHATGGQIIAGHWQGYQGSFYLGRFRCSTAPRPTYPWHESCFLAADKYAGAITVTFVISSAVD